MLDLIIRNARIALPDGTLLEGDLGCRDGLIHAVNTTLADGARREIEGAGQLLMPGVIDPQVHFRDPGGVHKEDLASGSRAAVRGGVTSFLEMPNTDPPTISQDALDAKLRAAARKSVANYGFFIGATPHNLQALNEVSPVCGIKIFMGSSTGTLLINDDKVLERIFASGERLIAVHAEDERRIQSRARDYLEQYPKGRMPVRMHSLVRDTRCAVLATERVLELSCRYRRRLHILHLSTADEVEMLRVRKPPWVSAEVIPNHLFLNTGDYHVQGALVQMNPPLRDPEHNDALWLGLGDGVLDIIATDHAPHTLEEKARPYPASPSGMPGVETSLPLMLNEWRKRRFTLEALLQWMCEGPARLYGIANKGRIEPGMDADLVLADTDTCKVLTDADVFSRAGWSPYSGRSLSGWPSHTIVGGRVAYENGVITPGVTGKPLRFERSALLP